MGIKKLTGYGKNGKKLTTKEKVGLVLDHAVPYGMSAAFDYNGQQEDSALAGRVVGHAVRKGIKALTGVGHYDIENKPKREKKPMKPGDRRAVRGQVLRILMNQGKTFSEASKEVTKYIEEHSL
jgi:hypothetical protein